MFNENQDTTLAIEPCGVCGAGLIEGSKYCRLCGARQSHSQSLTSTGCELSAGTGQRPAVESYQTTKLAQQIVYHPVSGPLVKALSTGLPAHVSGSRTKEIPKRLLLALMAIPIWVMIILLSPIDAYASAKIIGERI